MINQALPLFAMILDFLSENAPTIVTNDAEITISPDSSIKPVLPSLYTSYNRGAFEVILLGSQTPSDTYFPFSIKRLEYNGINVLNLSVMPLGMIK